MTMKKLMFVVVLIAGFVTSAFAQARPTLGVLPFTGGVEGEGDAIASLFLAQRELRDTFNVVPRNMALSAIFNERQFQLSDLTDPGTIASLNRMFNADYVLAGSITDVGGRNLLIASIIHVESFEQVAGIYVTYGSPEEVIGLLPSISARLTNAASRHRPAGRQRLAVVPFAHPATVNAQDAETLAQILAIEVLHTGRYTVVPRLSIIQAALREQGFQMLGYTDDAGMASLGRAMNANLVLGGSISRFGAANFFTSQILNVVDGRVMGADTVQYGLIGEGVEAMGELAIGMTAPPGPQRERLLIELGLRQNHPVPVPGANLAAQLDWLRGNAVSNTHYLIELSQDVAIGNQVLHLPLESTNVTVTLRGIGARRTISPSGTGGLFLVGNVTLVLDENITLQGRSDSLSPLVSVPNATRAYGVAPNSWTARPFLGIRPAGTVIMKEGAQITGNINNPYRDHPSPGGVYNRGTFIMIGGEIHNNKGQSGSNGSNGSTFGFRSTGGNGGNGGFGGTGGVYNRGTFIMHGGTIRNNTGGNGGNGGNGGTGGGGDPGVSIWRASANRPARAGNPNSGNGGNGGNGSNAGNGGITNHGTFVMHGGAIYNNTAGTAGSAGSGGSGGNPLSGGTRGRAGSSGTNGTDGVANVVNNGAFRITNGEIGSGFAVPGGTAHRGAYNASGVFLQQGTLSTTDNTLLVANGILQ